MQREYDKLPSIEFAANRNLGLFETFARSSGSGTSGPLLPVTLTTFAGLQRPEQAFVQRGL